MNFLSKSSRGRRRPRGGIADANATTNGATSYGECSISSLPNDGSISSLSRGEVSSNNMGGSINGTPSKSGSSSRYYYNKRMDGIFDDDDDSGNYDDSTSSRNSSTMDVIGNGSTRHSVQQIIEPSQRRSAMSELPITKLNTSSTALFGRTEEIRILHDCFRTLKEKNERQLVLVSGCSGTGKTALASTLREPVSTCGGLFCRGKFDLQNSNKPYWGLKLAFREICGAMLELSITNPKEFHDLQRDITNQLGSNGLLPILIQMIPELEEISDTNVDVDESASLELSRHRVTNNTTTTIEPNGTNANYAIKRFFQLVSKRFKWLVLVIDDLQWSDAASLELLENWVTDREKSTSILIVGIYRSNEVVEQHPFRRRLEGWRMKIKDRHYTIIEIEIGNLPLQAAQQVVQAMLRVDKNDDESILELADLCFKRTGGNIFFLRLLLFSLHEKNLIQYNIFAYRWIWDVNELMSRIPASDNVVDLLMSNMSNLQPRYLEILKLAACLGSIFKLSILKILLLELPSASNNRYDVSEELPQALKSLVKDGYLVHVEDGSSDLYQFGHDKIQETSSLLIPEAERMEFYYRVGRTLLDNFDAQELDSAIFVVVDLLNKGPDSSKNVSRIELATLNYQACRKAFAVSAFEAATEYAASGIALLGDDSWIKQYKFTLDIYSMAAEAEGLLGREGKMKKYCMEILARTDIPALDKLRAYHALIDLKYSQEDSEGAARAGLEVLQQLRIRFPKRKISKLLHLLINLAKVKSTLQQTWTVEKIDKLTVTKDRSHYELSRFFDKLATILYTVDDKLGALLIFHNLERTKKLGLNDYSPAAMATTGIALIVAYGGCSEASRVIAESALHSLHKVDNPHKTEARVLFLVNSFVAHWSTPIKDVLQPLMQAYEAGLQSGDLESACFSFYFFIIFRSLMGTPLEQIDIDAQKFDLQLKDLNRIRCLDMLTLNRQLWLKLIGGAEGGNSLRLDGELVTREKIERLRKDGRVFDGEVRRCEAQLWCYFGAHERLANIVLEEKGEDARLDGSITLIPHAVARGVSSFAAYRKTKNKEFKKMGMLMRSKVNAWLASGNPNVLHSASFLDAEFHASNRNISKALKTFEKAVLLSARGGLLLDAALISERFGELYLEIGDTENAIFRLQKAIQYYGEVDAYGLVGHMHAKYGHVMPKPSDVLTSSFIEK